MYHLIVARAAAEIIGLAPNVLIRMFNSRESTTSYNWIANEIVSTL